VNSIRSREQNLFNRNGCLRPRVSVIRCKQHSLSRWVVTEHDVIERIAVCFVDHKLQSVGFEIMHPLKLSAIYRNGVSFINSQRYTQLALLALNSMQAKQGHFWMQFL
jgi:hypothetical protein